MIFIAIPYTKTIHCYMLKANLNGHPSICHSIQIWIRLKKSKFHSQNFFNNHYLQKFYLNEKLNLYHHNSYPLSTLVRLLAQIVYLIEYYFFYKMTFQSNWQIYSTSLSWLVFFLLYSKLQKKFLFLRKIQN